MADNLAAVRAQLAGINADIEYIATLSMSARQIIMSVVVVAGASFSQTNKNGNQGVKLLNQAAHQFALVQADLVRTKGELQNYINRVGG